MRLLNYLKMKRNYRKPFALIVIAILFICLSIAIALFTKGNGKEKNEIEQAAEETSMALTKVEEIDIPNLANKELTQKDGKGDGFYKPSEDTKVVVNYGSGDMDFTKIVEDWCFGEPMINLREFAKASGATIKRSSPRDFNDLSFMEVYPEGEDPDLDGFICLWLTTIDGRTYKYISGSRMSYDSDGNFYASPVYVEKLSEDNLSVPCDLLPLSSYKKTPYYTVRYEYSDEKVVISLEEDEAQDFIDATDDINSNENEG